MPWSPRLLFPPDADLNSTTHHLHYYLFTPAPPRPLQLPLVVYLHGGHTTHLGMIGIQFIQGGLSRPKFCATYSVCTPSSNALRNTYRRPSKVTGD